MRAGYFGPEGTYTQEALLADTAGRELDTVPLPTIYDAVMAVHEGTVDVALVPIENSLEGSVNATLDALAIETDDVVIVGEVVHPIRHCLIARTPLELGAVEAVVSHPQATAQCARFIRTRLPSAQVLAGASTAEAVRMVAGHDGPWAALGNRLAAELYGCVVLHSGVEDVAGNETRFVWLARARGFQLGGADDMAPLAEAVGSLGAVRSGLASPFPGDPSSGDPSSGDPSSGDPSSGDRPLPAGPWKTAVVFWGVGAEAPGWLVACLSEFARRGVNLTRIESRPRKQGLGRYMFFVDLEGRVDDPPVRESLAAVRGHVQTLRVLGSFPAAWSA